MRIAFVTPEYVTENNFDGGLANYLHRVCLALRDLGHQPVVFVGSNRSEIISAEGIEIHRVCSVRLVQIPIVKRIFSELYLFSAPSWFEQSFVLNRALEKEHKKKPIDIVQYSSYAATGLFRVKKIPCVVRISSLQSLWREAQGHKNPSRDDAMLERMELKSFCSADGIFGPSVFVAKKVREVTGKSVEIIETPFLFETEKLDRSIFEKELSGKKYLLFWGSIGRHKGIETLADTIEALMEKNPELYFVLIGKDLGFDGGSMVDQVKMCAGKYAERIIHFGKMAHEMLYPIVDGAYAVVLPSLVENFSNVCLEAMAHKKVVIGTNGTSFEQLLEEGKSGFLCQPGDAAELLRSMEKVLALPESERLAIGEKAFERVLELTPEKVVNKLLEYYGKIIGEWRK